MVNNMLATTDRLDTYAAELRPIFRRADQASHFRSYLRGLLEPIGRKNVEAIAALSARADADLAQALQHFVSHSPWDCQELFAAVRKLSVTRRRDPDAKWVVHDVAFPKKGRHSVGVHRQFARDVGKKINCQLAVFVSQVGPGGYFPLAARLYLPGSWLREHGESAAKSIPLEHREPATKAELGLRLIDELLAEREPSRDVIAEAGYSTSGEFAEGLAKRGLCVSESETALGDALHRLEWVKAELGLDHFEGRTWQGWHHHVSLVFAAYHLLAGEGGSAEAPPFRAPASPERYG